MNFNSLQMLISVLENFEYVFDEYQIAINKGDVEFGWLLDVLRFFWTHHAH